MKAKEILEALQNSWMLPGTLRVEDGKSLMSDLHKSNSVYSILSGQIDVSKSYFMIDVRVAAVFEKSLRGIECAVIRWICDQYYAIEIDD